MAPADVYGVASFYGLFSLAERPARVVHVCTDLACQAGASALVDGLRERCGPPGRGETWPACAGGAATWTESPCLGVCERAPAALVTQYGEGHTEAVLAPATLDGLMSALEDGPAAVPAEPPVAAAVPQASRPAARISCGVMPPIAGATPQVFLWRVLPRSAAKRARNSRQTPAPAAPDWFCCGGSGWSIPPASTTTAPTAGTRRCGEP